MAALAAADSRTPAEEAMAAVPVITTKKVTIPDRLKSPAQKRVADEARKRSVTTQQSIDEVKQALEQEAKRRPVKTDFFDDPYGPFYKPEWLGLQIVVWINRQHPFYSMC